MTQRCSSRQKLETWSCQGCGAALPDELAEHLKECSSCAQELSQIEAVRSAASKLSIVEVSEQKANEIRFALMAAARETSRPGAGQRRGFSSAPPARLAETHRARRWVPWVALAAAVIALAIGLRRELWPALAPMPASYAEVTLAPGASGSQVAPGPHETFVLVEGKARFTVEKLHAGQTYRVVVGSDHVAVRGTTFAVEARGGRLQTVRVVEGVVVVTVDGSEVAALRQGEHWRRKGTLAAASVPARAMDSDEETEPSETETPNEAEQDHAPGEPVSGAGDSEPARVKAASAVHPSSEKRVAAVAGGASAVAGEALRKARAKAHGDEAFQKAWGLLQTGNPRAAALAFDELSADTKADSGRRADARFWAARAYFQAGASGTAKKRARAVVDHAPGSWHAPHAALLLAEMELAQGRSSAARRWLDRARSSGNSKVVERANKLEGQLK